VAGISRAWRPDPTFTRLLPGSCWQCGSELLAATEPPKSLSVAHLSKAYGATPAVQDLSFELGGGEIAGLLGPNGAGKTTTLLCLAGLLRPDSGQVAWQGEDLGSHRSRFVALVPDSPDVFEMLTVWEHMIFVARSCRLVGDWSGRASALLERFGMSAHRDTLGAALSRGMRQKVLIATSVLADKPVLLLDEPMVGLDPTGQQELRQLLLELRQQGVAIMVSTHLLENAKSFCDRLLVLKQGGLVASGELAEVVGRYGGSLEAAFLEVTT